MSTGGCQLSSSLTFIARAVNEMAVPVRGITPMTIVPHNAAIWEEPFGHVAIPAMVNGVALGAAGSGGLGDIVRDGETGFLMPPADWNTLAPSLWRVLSDRGLAEQLGCAGHQRAMTEDSETKLGDRFLQLDESICLRARVER